MMGRERSKGGYGGGGRAESAGLKIRGWLA